MLRTMTCNRLKTAGLLAAVLLTLGAAEAQAQWGTLKGKFVYDGAPRRRPRSTSIRTSMFAASIRWWTKPAGGRQRRRGERGDLGSHQGRAKLRRRMPESASATVVYDNKGCRFEPHILAVQTSQTLEVHNSDPISHNSNMAPSGRRSDQSVAPRQRRR